MITKKAAISTVALACALVGASATTNASAAALACTPTATTYHQDTTLAIYCSNTSSWYFSSANASVETKRIWMSMVQSAMLAGKNIQIDNQTGGFVWIQLDR